MSELADDLKLSNLEITDNSCIRLSSQMPTIKHIRPDTTQPGGLHISSDDFVELNATELNINAAMSVNSSISVGNLTLTNGFIGSMQEGLIGGATGTPTAVLLTTLITTLNIDGTKFVSLAAGTVGQMKIITATVNTGTSIVLRFTAPAGATTLTFNAVGDSATLVYTTQGWVVINSINLSS